MSTNSNVFSQGGGGVSFEIALQTAYYISFILGAHIPGMEDGHITAFKQQSGSLEYETDDLLLTCEGRGGSCRILIQAKHLITISSGNPMFQKVVMAAWRDFRNPELFTPQTDKFFLISATWPTEVKTHLVQLLDWAKSKDSTADFDNEVSRIGAKKRYYDHFTTVIRVEEPAVTPQTLHAFLRCFEVLEYDLDRQASVTKAHMLSLLETARQPDAETAENIWNEIYQEMAAKNAAGGISLEAALSKYKGKLQPSSSRKLQKELQRLSAESMSVLEVINDRIGGEHLPRHDLLAAGLEKLYSRQILMVTGDPGAGKSAAAKNLLALLRRDRKGYVIAMRADELGSGQLRNWFREAGIQQSVEEIFSLFPLQPNGIIYIDAFEKLLEGEDLAFKQLLKAMAKMPTVKLVISCRKSLLSTLHLRFFSDAPYEELLVPYLSEQELSEVTGALPQLSSAVANPQISQLVRIPKYLDFIYTAGNAGQPDYSIMNVADLQARLWEAIVENRFDEFKDGLPQKRREAFIEVAVNRSQKMEVFTSIEKADPEALEKLLKENVIVKAKNHPKYSPAHDVLEDWALVKHVDKIFDNKSSDQHFFESLGATPAMRRAYRLWVADAILQQSPEKIAYFTRNLPSKSATNHWRHPCLIAILNSPHCEKFLQDNLSVLRESDWQLFFEIIHVMRTACRESIEHEGKPLLVPTGHGWLPVIRIMWEHLKIIPPVHYAKIQALISDWSTVVDATDTLPKGSEEAGQLLLFLFDSFVTKEERDYGTDKWVKEAIILLYKLAGGIDEQITLWLEALAQGKEQTAKVSATLKKHRHLFISTALSALTCKQLARHLPQPLLALARSCWYRTADAPKPTGIAALIMESQGEHTLQIERLFGLRKNLGENYSPASALQTPIYWLLKFHPHTIIDFIIELLNYCTEHYVKSRLKDRDEIISIKLNLPDGSIVTQTGSYPLWQLYRGTSTVMPYLLQSVMMALEKYLYELAAAGKDRELLIACMWKLYTQSNTVATIGVVSSIVQAFPSITENLLLPLIDQPAIYKWEVQRYVDDFRNPILVMADQVYVDERYHAKELPHRRKYNAGLRSFIIDYCFNVGAYNDQIYSIIDQMRSAADASDLNYAQLLDDIDLRVWEIQEEKEFDGQLYRRVGPAYRQEVFDMVKKNEQEIEARNRESGFMRTLREARENKTELTLKQWREIFAHYSSFVEFHSLHHVPGLLAYHGVAHWPQFTIDEHIWVASRLFHIADDLYRTHGGSLASTMHHLYDTEAVLAILPKLLDFKELDEEDKYSLLKVIAHIAIKHTDDNDPMFQHFLEGYHYHFWKNHPDSALLIWKGAVNFAQYLKTVPPPEYKDEEQYTAEKHQQLDTYVDLVLAGKIDFELDKLQLERYQNWSLLTGIDLIGDHEPIEQTRDYLLKLLDLYFAYDERKDKKEDSRYGYDDSVRVLNTKLKDKFAGIILTSAEGCGAKLLLTCCSKIAALGSELDLQNGEYPAFFDFWTEVAKKIILKTDHLVFNDKANIALHVKRFQLVWRKLAGHNFHLPYMIFSIRLFLDIEWKKDVRDWPPLKGMSDFFLELTKAFGKTLYVHVINLLATIGDKELLPGCFVELVRQLRELDRGKFILYKYTFAEPMAMRLYNHHLDALRQNSSDFEAYIWFLERLIEEGSTDGYWIMEFVITYKDHPSATVQTYKS